jgi:hypothetical protein
VLRGSGIAFSDRGRVELKGIPREWQLFAVAGKQPGASSV